MKNAHTLYVKNPVLWRQLQRIAFEHRTSVSAIVENLVSAYVLDHESRCGNCPTLPVGERLRESLSLQDQLRAALRK